MDIDKILDEEEKNQKKLNKITPEELSKMELHKQNLIMMGQGPSIMYILPIAKLTGVNSAMFFGYLISEERKLKTKLTEDGFFCLQEGVKKEIRLSDYQQRSAGKKLEKNKLIEIKYKGMPAKKYFKINRETLEGLPE